MAITKEDIRHIAMLSRLEITEAEEAKFTEQLNTVLEAAQKLQTLDTENVAPTIHILPLQNVFRADEARPSMEREKLTANAPEVEDGFFKVPRIV